MRASAINIADLKALIADLPDDMPAILQKDAEGNGYSPLSGGAESLYEAESTWSGQAYPTADEIADPDSDYTDEDEAPDSAIQALVLWPVN